MKILNLTYIEIKKIIKRKVFLFLLILLALSFISSLFITLSSKSEVEKRKIGTTQDIKWYKANLEYGIMYKNSQIANREIDKEFGEEILRLYNQILDEGAENYYDGEYKDSVLSDYTSALNFKYKLEKEENIKEAKKFEEDANRLLKIFKKRDSFDEFMEYKFEKLEEKYNSNEISNEEYINEKDSLNRKKIYEIGKNLNDHWKEEYVLSKIEQINTFKIVQRLDYKYINDIWYVTDDDLIKAENEKMILDYMLKNNIPPYYSYEQARYNLNGFLRYTFDNIEISTAMILIGIFAIIISASSIAEEKSSGTLKFLLVTPCRRYKILLAKIFSIIIVVILLTIVVSQISAIVRRYFIWKKYK